ncbi:MAG: DUF92 domain-containing protein [Candidatus Diapherotrites archaeon]|nr:DUF92 domain-containing protein [Candidatus Diapherotrites archaeon]
MYELLPAVIAILVFFSILSYRLRALDFFGVVVGFAVGLLVFLLSGIVQFAAMLLFFVVAEFCTRCANLYKAKRHSVRTASNILGNSLAAVIALAVGSNIAYFGAVAAALADTISSELGIALGQKPRLVTNLRKVAIGTNGAVSLYGLVVSAMGALVIALVYFLAFGNAKAIVFIAAAGFLGGVADSFAGAVLERKGLINNATVNFIGSATGAVIAYLLFAFA